MSNLTSEQAVEQRLRQLEAQVVDLRQRLYASNATLHEWQQRSAPLLWRPGRASHEPLPPVGDSFTQTSFAEAVQRLGDNLAAEALTAAGYEAVAQAAAYDTQALPAEADRENYYAGDPLGYWLMGHGDYLVMRDALREHRADLPKGAAVLDLGCASGRIARHFALQGDDWQVYGSDIDPRAVQWGRKHLGQHATFFLNTILPRLPLADASLDFAYGHSLFTHIDEFEEGWLLELRRVLKPGGHVFITFHSERLWSLLKPGHFLYDWLASRELVIQGLDTETITPELFAEPMPAERVVFRIARGNINHINTFTSVDYVRRQWGRILEPVAFYERAHGRHQDAVLLRKPL